MVSFSDCTAAAEVEPGAAAAASDAAAADALLSYSDASLVSLQCRCASEKVVAMEIEATEITAATTAAEAAATQERHRRKVSSERRRRRQYGERSTAVAVVPGGSIRAVIGHLFLRRASTELFANGRRAEILRRNITHKNFPTWTIFSGVFA